MIQSIYRHTPQKAQNNEKRSGCLDRLISRLDQDFIDGYMCRLRQRVDDGVGNIARVQYLSSGWLAILLDGFGVGRHVEEVGCGIAWLHAGNTQSLAGGFEA